MVLVDTSILIGYFKGLSGYPYKKLDEIIDMGTPFGICNQVYQELLQGVKSEKEFQLLREYLNTLTFYGLREGRKSYENAAIMYAKCRKSGVTIRSTVDLIVAEVAIENHLYLLHNDNDFLNMSKVIHELMLYE
ncbi:MAG: PIN domain nuclease [Prevotellaceae bacterium]|jgi:predicted nucleic acid-binding protein|nr:PIN domain nuclease [Prevotellaceae bacterium]